MMENHIDCNDEFDIQESPFSETAVQRLKEFSYYLIENIELNLNFCLDLLEERKIADKANSTPVNVASLLSMAVPSVGKGVSSAIKQGEIFIHKKIDKKNSCILADLVYCFSDNRERFRRILIEAAVNLFYCLENQFMRLTCDGGPKRAMQKLAKDASNRVFTYFLETNQTREVTKNEITKGVILGESLRDNSGIKSGRTVRDDYDHKWKTADIYSKVGLFLEEPNREFYRYKHSKSEIFGYRRIFPWEDVEDIRKTWMRDLPPNDFPKFYLKAATLEELKDTIREYIMGKNPNEESKLDREKKHQESMEHRDTKHEYLIEKLGGMLEELRVYNLELLKRHQDNKEIIEMVEKKQNILIESQNHEEIAQKLITIHQDVAETKQGQVELKESTDEIKKEICIIKDGQAECSGAAVVSKKQVKDAVGELVKDNYEVKKVKEAIDRCTDMFKKENINKIVKENYEVKRLINAVEDCTDIVKKNNPERIVKKKLKRYF